MSNTFNTNVNSPFRIVGSGANLHQKRKSINPGSAYSVGTEEGFSSSTNLDATLRGLKKQIHQNSKVRGAAQSATEHRKGEMSPLPLIRPNRMKRQSAVTKDNDSSIRLPPLDSHGETDSIAEVVNKFPSVHKRTKNKTPPQKPDPFTPYRTPGIRESERLTPVKHSRGAQKRGANSKSSRSKNQVGTHNSATQLLTPSKGGKIMKREFSKILEKGEEFEVRRSQSSLKMDQLHGGKADNTPHRTPELTPEEGQRIDRKNRAKRNPLASKVYKSQQRKFEEVAEVVKRGDIMAKASSIRASKLTAHEQIQLRPRKTTRSQKAQDRSSAATDLHHEDDMISPYKPKRPKALYDKRGHRIKAPAANKKHFKNSDLQISPWS